MKKHYPIIVILSCLLFLQFGIMATEFNPRQLMEKESQAVLLDTRVHSLSIAIVHKTKSYTGHFGKLTTGKDNRPSNDTLYEIGSVSKTMVGLLVADAVHNKLLSLDSDISVYLPHSDSPYTHTTSPMTVRQLLTHTSGLPKLVSEFLDEQTPVNKDAFLTTVSHYEHTKRQGKFGYSNVAYELLGHILSRVYHRPFEHLLKDKLKTLANMSDSYIQVTTENMNNYAHGHNAQGNQAKGLISSPTLWGSSGYVKSTISDLVKYMKLQLNTEHSVIKLSHQTLFQVTESDALAYAWISATDRKLGRYLIHHGGTHGTQNWMIIFPDKQMAISIISNTSFPELASKLRDSAFVIANELNESDK